MGMSDFAAVTKKRESPVATPTDSAPAPKRTFVLVHGSFTGGWCWRPVASLLEANGHRVFAPSLTGLAERSHLLAPSVGLETHILDIANLIEWEDLDDIVLVGHSYGGMVTGGVAQRLHRRISSLVFADAVVPVEGIAIITEGTDRLRKSLNRLREQGGYYCTPVPPVDGEIEDAARMRRHAKLTPHPLKTYLDCSGPTDAYDQIRSKLFVRASQYSQVAIERSFDRARKWGWNTVVLDCGHDLMHEQPNAFAELLLLEATGSSHFSPLADLRPRNDELAATSNPDQD
jgi:pimeloyl-ACP methyl ester carboxylesterase